MENVKRNMSKNKLMKRVLCYISLVFLIVLLFIPMIFRIVFKDKKKEVSKDVITIISCESSNESINSTFLNNEPKNILYQIVGNYTTNPSEENTQDEDITDISTIIAEKPVLKKLLNYGELVFDEEKNLSSLRISVDTMAGSLDYEVIFNNITNQEEYYKLQGFSCNRTYK